MELRAQSRPPCLPGPSHATLALAAGIHPKVVQERLGHSSNTMTLDLHSHAIPAMQADAADRIAAADRRQRQRLEVQQASVLPRPPRGLAGMLRLRRGSWEWLRGRRPLQRRIKPVNGGLKTALVTNTNSDMVARNRVIAPSRTDAHAPPGWPASELAM